MNIRRTYPQPDSKLSHLTPRERSLALLKYVGEMEPEVVRTPDGEFTYLEILALFEDQVTTTLDLGARAISIILPQYVHPEQHPMLQVAVHAFEQERRRRAGQPLLESLVEMRRS